jgi:hypothetical protein
MCLCQEVLLFRDFTCKHVGQHRVVIKPNFVELNGVVDTPHRARGGFLWLTTRARSVIVAPILVQTRYSHL